MNGRAKDRSKKPEARRRRGRAAVSDGPAPHVLLPTVNCGLPTAGDRRSLLQALADKLALEGFPCFGVELRERAGHGQTSVLAGGEA